jgi:alpha-beta hydrolase superfamily lysophospholipase
MQDVIAAEVDLIYAGGLDQLVEVLKLPRLRTGGATLNQNPATTPTGCHYSVNGIEMHVLIAGSGPDVLLLHGFPDSHKLWRYQIPGLVAAGFRVIAPDLRGYGLTENPERRCYGLSHGPARRRCRVTAQRPRRRKGPARGA